MIKKNSAITFEKALFYSCLGISLLTIIFNTTNPTLDGPSHVYNARIINYLIGGNEFIGKYYTLNKIPVANLTDHYLLALLMSIFSWQAAEELLLIFYLLSFSLLFRALIRQWNSASIGFSIFAIPFSFSFMYYIGFYNFCLSFPLLFGIIIYYRKYFSDEDNTPSLKRYFILCLLATLTYFTNGLTFLFAGLGLVLFEIPLLIRLFSDNPNASVKITLKRLLLFFMIWIPGALCFLVFLYKAHFNSGSGSIPFSELIVWIHDVRPLYVYGISENIYTKYFFYLISAALIIAIYFRTKKRIMFKFNSSDALLLLAVITFLLYILMPDEANVGMMSVRLCYYFFIFLLLWIAVQQGSKIITSTISVAVIVIHFTLLFKAHQSVLADLRKQIEMVRDAGKVIKPNSVIMTVDVTDNWLLMHFPDYMGVDKPLVILNNYEPNDGWFAVNWNNYKIPRMLLNASDTVPPNLYIFWIPSKEIKIFDYVFVYGNYSNFRQKDDWKVLNDDLQKDYKLTYTSTDNLIHIFSLTGD